MRTRIDHCFSELKKSGKKGFIAYITAGDPGLKSTVDMALRLEDVGVDMLEIGIPFSDPLADGGVNHAAATRALAAGATPAWVMECLTEIRTKSSIPVIFYTYLNLMVQGGGMKASLDEMEERGADGVLILDLPSEEMGPYRDDFRHHALNHIRLVTPTSPVARIRNIVQDGSGFIYCVSRAGVTGMQAQGAGNDAGALLRRTRRCTKLPLALGFGISTPAQAAAAAIDADAVVVGSAIVQRFYDEKHTPAGRRAAAEWVGQMVQAVKGA